jgi:hypothetical protein
MLLIIFSPLGLLAEREPSDLPIGETIRYAIHTSGVKIGMQTIKVVSRELYDFNTVYRVRARMRITGLLSIFYNYHEQWTVLIDEKTLYPVWVERQIEDRGKSTTYTYIIDQENRKVFVSNGNEKSMIIHTENVVFDRLSLCYYYRENPSFFDGESSFDFLYKESVHTVSMEESGLTEIRIPKLSTDDSTSAMRFIEKGGEGIEVFVGIEGFGIPLKVVFRTPVPNRKKAAEVELFLEGYAVDQGNRIIPKRYRRLLNLSLLTLHV